MIPVSKIYAQSSIADKFNALTSSPGDDLDFETFINNLIRFLIPLAVLCAGVLLAFSAFKMISSKGDPEALKDAREQIGNAITGLIFIILSGAIFALISRLILTGV